MENRAVMEKSPSDYRRITTLFRNNTFKATDFYQLVEKSDLKETQIGNSVNAMEHVWGYFKKTASEKELRRFQKSIKLMREGSMKEKTIKNFLYKLALKNDTGYLLDSYYFDY